MWMAMRSPLAGFSMLTALLCRNLLDSAVRSAEVIAESLSSIPSMVTPDADVDSSMMSTKICPSTSRSFCTPRSAPLPDVSHARLSKMPTPCQYPTVTQVSSTGAGPAISIERGLYVALPTADFGIAKRIVLVDSIIANRMLLVTGVVRFTKTTVPSMSSKPVTRLVRPKMESPNCASP